MDFTGSPIGAVEPQILWKNALRSKAEYARMGPEARPEGAGRVRLRKPYPRLITAATNGGIQRLQTSRETNAHSSVYLAVTRVTDGLSGQAATMQDKMNLKQSPKRTRQDFAVTMMLAAVVGAVRQAAQIVLEIDGSAGWWH